MRTYADVVMGYIFLVLNTAVYIPFLAVYYRHRHTQFIVARNLRISIALNTGHLLYSYFIILRTECPFPCGLTYVIECLCIASVTFFYHYNIFNLYYLYNLAQERSRIHSGNEADDVAGINLNSDTEQDMQLLFPELSTSTSGKSQPQANDDNSKLEIAKKHKANQDQKNFWFIKHRYLLNPMMVAMYFFAINFISSLPQILMTFSIPDIDSYSIWDDKCVYPILTYYNLLVVLINIVGFIISSYRLLGMVDENLHMKAELKLVAMIGFICIILYALTYSVFADFSNRVIYLNNMTLLCAHVGCVLLHAVYPYTHNWKLRDYFAFLYIPGLKSKDRRVSAEPQNTHDRTVVKVDSKSPVKRSNNFIHFPLLAFQSSSTLLDAMNRMDPNFEPSELRRYNEKKIKRQGPKGYCMIDFLSSSEGFDLFKQFCVKEFSVENLLFIEAAYHFKRIGFQTVENMVEGRPLMSATVQILGKFIVVNSPMELNIPHKKRQQVKKSLMECMNSSGGISSMGTALRMGTLNSVVNGGDNMIRKINHAPTSTAATPTFASGTNIVVVNAELQPLTAPLSSVNPTIVTINNSSNNNNNRSNGFMNQSSLTMQNPHLSNLRKQEDSGQIPNRKLPVTASKMAELQTGTNTSGSQLLNAGNPALRSNGVASKSESQIVLNKDLEVLESAINRDHDHSLLNRIMTLFDDVIVDIIVLMEKDSYRRFSQTKEFKQFVEENEFLMLPSTENNAA